MNYVSIWVWICVVLCTVHISIQNSLRRNKNGILRSQRAFEEAEITFICPQNGIFPHDQFCEKYYNCSSGLPTPEIWECRTTADFLFNDMYGECDYAFQVHCGHRLRPDHVSSTMMPPHTTTPRTTTTSRPTTTRRPIPIFNCTVNGPSGTYPHPVFCEKYYDCWEGFSTLLICPNDTLFDIRDEWLGCAPPQDVDCGDRIRPPDRFQCPPDAEDGQHYPDPGNCAAFFVCTHGHPVHTLCASGLLYNPILGVCDHPANVDCSDRHRIL